MSTPTPWAMMLADTMKREREILATRPGWATCGVCRAYAERRRAKLAPALGDKVQAEGRPVPDVVDEYMGKVHQRHLDGLPI